MCRFSFHHSCFGKECYSWLFSLIYKGTCKHTIIWLEKQPLLRSLLQPKKNVISISSFMSISSPFGSVNLTLLVKIDWTIRIDSPIFCESCIFFQCFAGYLYFFDKITLNLHCIIPTMITTFGMKDGMYSDPIIAKIDMDALFG